MLTDGQILKFKLNPLKCKKRVQRARQASLSLVLDIQTNRFQTGSDPGGRGQRHLAAVHLGPGRGPGRHAAHV